MSLPPQHCSFSPWVYIIFQIQNSEKSELFYSCPNPILGIEKLVGPLWFMFLLLVQSFMAKVKGNIHYPYQGYGWHMFSEEESKKKKKASHLHYINFWTFLPHTRKSEFIALLCVKPTNFYWALTIQDSKVDFQVPKGLADSVLKKYTFNGKSGMERDN